MCVKKFATNGIFFELSKKFDLYAQIILFSMSLYTFHYWHIQT